MWRCTACITGNARRRAQVPWNDDNACRHLEWKSIEVVISLVSICRWFWNLVEYIYKCWKFALGSIEVWHLGGDRRPTSAGIWGYQKQVSKARESLSIERATSESQATTSDAFNLGLLLISLLTRDILAPLQSGSALRSNLLVITLPFLDWNPE